MPSVRGAPELVHAFADTAASDRNASGGWSAFGFGIYYFLANSARKLIQHARACTMQGLSSRVVPAPTKGYSSMHQVRRMVLVRAFEIFDVLALSFAAASAWAFVDPACPLMRVRLPDLLDQAVTMRSAVIGGALLWVWHALLLGRRLYSSRRLSSFRTEVRDVVISTAYATGALAVMTWAFARLQFRLEFLVLFFAISLLVLLPSRLTLRFLLRQLRLRGHNLRHVVIVGTNERSQRYAAELRRRPELGYIIGGFVGEPGDQPPEARADRVVCSFERFPEYLRANVVDEVVVLAPVKSFYEEISRVVAACEEQGIVARVLSDLFETSLGHLRVEEVPGISFPLVTVYTGRMRGWPMVVKRLIDILGALLLLVVASPVMGMAALAVRLGSGPGVLFAQERLGLSKRRFRMYKFRTMVPDAEARQKDLESLNEVSGPVFKIQNDPRITPVGRFLRRTSIDELPQLFNVLKGDMSLVGPRPLPVRDYERFNDDAHRRRFSVRPGITCLWQVYGRNDIPFERWMQLDMEYIDRWSLSLDILILAKTLPAVFRATGS
jgi:exopolysaccharide biosynthesis polyprenyl glycosylphosphotransferase